MLRSVIVLATCAVIFAAYSNAGTLRVGVPTIDGNRVKLPVVLEGDVGEGVAALDFTLNYDPAVFTPVSAEASAAAQAARKQVESNEVSPGNYVVMMFGMNQTTVDGGQVAEITLNTRTQPTSNQSAVSIARTTFAAIDGAEIASEGSSQTVTFPVTANDGTDNGGPPVTGPSPVQTPPDSPVSTPSEPIKNPDSPNSVPPGISGGSPVSPDKPAEHAPRSTPLIIAGTQMPAQDKIQDSSTGIVEQMNRAVQRLENTRASLGKRGGYDDTGNVNTLGPADDSEPAELNPTPIASTPQPPNVSTNHEAKIALAPAGGNQELNRREVTPEQRGGKDIPDASGIPPSSRRMLIVVAMLVAVSLIIYRLAGRSSRNH